MVVIPDMPDALNKQHASDSPPPDLSRERDELLRNFTKGSQLTQDFLRAYDDLQNQVMELKTENARLRATVEADDAIRDLVKKIDSLESEKQDLLSKVHKVEAVVSAYPNLDELEVELANFANLHVATNCLHSTLSPRGVGRRIKEILEQLVGVEAYVVYLCTEANGLTPIAVEGLAEGESPTQGPTARLHDVVASGVSSIMDDVDPSLGTVDAPPVLIPLAIDDNVVGVLAIVRALAHKKQLSTVDFELFKLLGQHAAAALMAAGLYAGAKRQLPAADAFSSLSH